jgi:hypothetical protein
MKLQHLAVIFVIIILPITLLLNGYTDSQIKTLRLQLSYDDKLDNATYDALKAFQLNAMNSDTSDLANSKIRDIEASANTFFTSIASNFNMAGYNQDILKEYVPALVYVMYDGYYIYSPYTNTLDDRNENILEGVNLGSDASILHPNNEDATYKQGEKISGLKPYIYYSCRYQYNGNDFVITYALDNYITIQGKINNEWVYDAGYLLDNITESGGNYSYRGVPINQNETLEEYIFNPESKQIEKYEYVKINGVKYYHDVYGQDRWFSLLNGEVYYQDNFSNRTTTAAKEYYKQAYEFKDRIKNLYKLEELESKHAVDENGNKTLDTALANTKVFDFGSMAGTSIEDPNSQFNQHRLAVIRHVIERNLSIAISNYNNYSGGITTDFQMPKLKEDEWEKIINNVSIISFLQGLNIGGKIYNGYSIITNDKNEELVKEDSIYIVTPNDNQYHRPNDKDLKNQTSSNIYGALNVDFERKSITSKEDGKIIYYIPQQNNGVLITGCYGSIIGSRNITQTDNLYQYMQQMATSNPSLATAYYTALGRERYSMYKTNNDPDKLKKDFGVDI